MSAPIILLTDFGLTDAYVGVIKGIIHRISVNSPVIDLCHHVEPQNIDHARALLNDNRNYFNQDAIFCCIVDPGVGSDRKCLVLCNANNLLIGPDNGIFSEFLADSTVYQIIPDENISKTFHGRDVFAPWAARLANDRSLLAQLKPLATNTLKILPPLDIRLNHEWQQIRILYSDHFGNLITNGLPQNSKVEVILNGQQMQIFSHYEAMPVGQLGVITGSSGRLEFSIPNGDAREQVLLKSDIRARLI